MKVYVLMSRTSEAHDFHGVFSIPEFAEEWINKWPEYVKEAYYIVEYELDYPVEHHTIKDFEYYE